MKLKITPTGAVKNLQRYLDNLKILHAQSEEAKTLYASLSVLMSLADAIEEEEPGVVFEVTVGTMEDNENIN